jgi:GNAT superfamily N-acetyltransferase
VPTLRTATAGDTEAVMDLLRLAHREAPTGRWAEARAREALAECLDPRTGAVLLSLSHGVPVAALGIVISRMWWSDDPILQERFAFVHPQHRRAPHARTLLEAARSTVQDAGMPLLIGVLSNIRAAGKVRLYERVFGAPAGATFLVEA